MKNRSRCHVRQVSLLLLLAPALLVGGSSVSQPIVCGPDPSDGCELITFDRTKIKAPDTPPYKPYIPAIRSAASKVLYSGTVIAARVPYQECEDSDWRLVLLSKESSNVLIYGPADVAEFCSAPPSPEKKAADPKPAAEEDNNKIVVIVPVSVIWAHLFHYPGNKGDPFRKAPTSGLPGSVHYCEGVKSFRREYQNGILPCDRFSWIGFAYRGPIGSLYNHLTQPGTWQGTLSFTPAIGKVPNTVGGPPGIKAPAETLNFDVQSYPSAYLGGGYIGFPVVFEKANAATANLNSLTAAVSYDLPLAVWWPQMLSSRDKGGSHPRLRAWLRPPDFRIQEGFEMAASTPHDLNLVAAATVRLPLAVDLYRQPSALSLFGVAGVEGGSHVVTHLLSEKDPILRKVIGFDSSLRLPFILTHAFLGDKPTTIDFAWRTRYLSYREPFTDYVSGIAESLTKQQRSYWRGSYIVPISTLAQFKVTVQHGGLPPDFNYLGYSLNLGLTFGNPGYSEH